MEAAAAGMDFDMAAAASATTTTEADDSFASAREDEEAATPAREEAAGAAHGGDAEETEAEDEDAQQQQPFSTPQAEAADELAGGGGDDDDDEGSATSIPLHGPNDTPDGHPSPPLGPMTAPDSVASSVFFADATLDLEEAHGLAETPVPRMPGRKVVIADADLGRVGPSLPSLNHGGGGAGAAGGIGVNENGGAGATMTTPGGGGAGFHDYADGEGTASKQPRPPNPSAPAGAPNGGAAGGRGGFAAITGGGIDSYAQQRPMESLSAAGPSASSSTMPSIQPTYRPRFPNRPRDARWAAAALTLIPLSLSLPFLLSRYLAGEDGVPRSGWESAAMSTQGHTATFLTCLFGFGATVAICRTLYRTPGGGDGDDARHRATDLIVNCAPVALAVLPVMALVAYVEAPGGWVVAFLPLLFFVKDVLVLRAGMAGPEMPTAGGGGIERGRRGGIGPGGGGGGGSSDDGRRTFFRALVCTALDILSRSLRRQSFCRFVSAALLLQFALVLLWKSSLFLALSVSHTLLGKVLVLLSLLGGKWATGTVSRVLSLVASGGVTSWFAQQSILIDEMDRMKDKRREEEEAEAAARRHGGAGTAGRGPKGGGGGGDASSVSVNVDDASEDGGAAGLGGDPTAAADAGTDDGRGGLGGAGATDAAAADAAARATARAALHAMPEAYRTADASVYSPVIDFDEGMDDDFEDEEDEVEEGMFVGGAAGGGGGSRVMGSVMGRSRGRRPTPEWTGGGSGGRSTVKSFLVSATTVSFGSVAQCGLLGGLAQFVWSLVRNADAFGSALTRRFSSARFGFRGMDVGDGWDGEGGAGGRGGESWQHRAMMLYGRTDVVLRDFVRGHSDLAMSHVAAYFKSYQRAANDVAALIDASGVEPIIHDDITTRMCAGVGTAVSGVVVTFIGYIVAHHRGVRDPSSQPPLSDVAICEIMLLCFIFCYTIIFTVMEPLRASIKAVYVCFAQHPQSLSQAFPLIFHRLTRISEANVVV